MPETLRQRRLALAALAAAGALWGASFPLGKFALQDLQPAHLVLYRFVIATALLAPLARWRTFRPTRGDWGRLTLTAALLVPVTFLLQFEGLDRTTATSAALLVGTAPPLLALMAWAFAHERPGRRTVAAAGLSTLGAALLVGGPGPGGSPVGDALVFAGMFSACGATLLSKGLVRRYDALAVTAALFGLGTLMLVPSAFAFGGPFEANLSRDTWLVVGGLGVGCTAATYALWNLGLRHVGAAESGVFVNIEPVVGGLLGVLWLGERTGPWALAGGALVLGAALLVTLGEGRRRTVDDPAAHEAAEAVQPV